ncbi:MAG: hypothetical protein HUK25_09115, partial [Treponema sp.]|nr:hypothetical protein [Treponema sp.]
KHNIAYFCLAHNLNDNLETILMRFLQGSRSGGIQSSRGVFIRPLINIERCDIEDFLKFKNQSYCIDSTNSCDNYLRNNIRLNLVPVLNEKFPGWKTAVLKGEEKRKLDNDCLESIAAKKDFSEDLFDSENEALLDRVLIKFFNQNGITGRIPKVFLKDFSSQLHNAVNKKKDFLQRYGEFETGYKNGNLFIKRLSKRQTDFCFFAIIEKEGEFQFPFGVVHVFKSESGAVVLSHSGKSVTYNVDFPFVIRSPVTGEKKQLYVVEG